MGICMASGVLVGCAGYEEKMAHWGEYYWYSNRASNLFPLMFSYVDYDRDNLLVGSECVYDMKAMVMTTRTYSCQCY